MIVPVEPLTAAAFAPFGDVLEPPCRAGRNAFGAGLANLRPNSKLDLMINRVEPVAASPVAIDVIERHRFSSQTFISLTVRRWIIVTAPPAANGMPDTLGLRAFLAGPAVGVTYRAGAWHAGLIVLDTTASFAVLTWRDGGPDDTDIVTLARAVEVKFPIAGEEHQA